MRPGDYSDQRDRNACRDIERRARWLTTLEEVCRFVAERAERRVGTAESNGQKPLELDRQCTTIYQPDDEREQQRSTDIDDEGSPRKRRSRGCLHPAADPVTSDRANGAAEGDEYCGHVPPKRKRSPNALRAEEESLAAERRGFGELHRHSISNYDTTPCSAVP